MLITSLVGMFLATRAGVPWPVLIFGNLGIALCAGGAAAVNHVVDRRIDALMARTHKRPLAEGRVSPVAALVFAMVLAVAGLALLLAFTNPLAAWLTLASLLGYAVIYTGFLKRATPQNIVIGGLAGAAPPLLGWVAVTGHVSAEPLLLVLIIFAWTPPHFWALAIHRKEEYAKADIPMLPVTHGEHYTKVHILLYTFALLAVSLMPYVIHMSGMLYLVCALVLGGRFLQWAWVLYRGSRPHAAINTFNGKGQGDPTALIDAGIILLPQSRQLPPVTMTNQDGQPVVVNELKGKWSVLFFGYTFCPDICPTTLAQLRQIKSELPKDVVDKLQVILVSVDPNRDTPAQLKQYLGYFDPQFEGLTGASVDDVQKVSNAVSIPFIPADTSKPNYTVDHSGNLALIGPDGTQRGFIRAPLNNQKLVAQFPGLLQ
eukprot:gene5447-8299_t